MLSTVLQRLEALLSKQFIVSSVFPLILVGVFNIFTIWFFLHFRLLEPRTSDFLLGLVSPLWSDFSVGRLAAAGVIFVFACILVGYVLSACNQLLREMLEGQHVPENIRRKLTERQQLRLNRLQVKLDSAKRWRREVLLMRDNWRKKLHEARERGGGAGTCSYSVQSEVGVRVAALRKLRNRCQTIEPGQLKEAVEGLERILEQNSAGRQGASQQAADLDRDHTDLLSLVDYSLAKLQSAYLKHYDRRQFNFPQDDVAPTALGNIANSIRSYTESRYSLHLDVLWTRFQGVIQKDAAFYTLLQDAKAQLDFLIVMLWLSLATGLSWSVTTGIWGLGMTTKIATPVCSIFLCWIWYKLAVQSYRAFADLLRSAVDLYRFDLLRFLHVPLPSDSATERVLWEKLSQSIGFADPQDFSYVHPEASQPPEAS